VVFVYIEARFLNVLFVLFAYFRPGPSVHQLSAMNPKTQQLTHIESSKPVIESDHDLGTAAQFAMDVSNVDKAKILRKMDLRIIPMVTVLYLFSFLDRGYVR
jgi:hypothetical protein